MTYLIYIFYNIIFQALSIWCLFYANTYLNDSFIPDSFKWKDGKLREDLTAFGLSQTIILIVEGALLTALMYYFNRWYSLNIIKSDIGENIATWTAAIYGSIVLIFILFLMYSAYK